MAGIQDLQQEDTVSFLPHRLNRQPVVVRGLTADELWICTGLSAGVGLLLGIPLAWLTSMIAMIPSLIVAAVTVGIFAGGGMLRRQKRGRPETWLYRQLQWWVALKHPSLAPYTGGRSLVTRSGCWTTRRWTTGKSAP
jgi:conjugative transfer region protein (TIGR03750 family)